MVASHYIVLFVARQKKGKQKDKDEQNGDDDHIRPHIHCRKVRFVSSVHYFWSQQILNVLRERHKVAIDELIFNDIELSNFNKLAKNVFRQTWYLNHSNHGQMHEQRKSIDKTPELR